MTFDVIALAPLPTGVVAHYRSRWAVGTGATTLEGFVIFSFHGARIERIGVRLDLSRMRALLEGAAPPDPRTAAS
jgi:hypothetical protein